MLGFFFVADTIIRLIKMKEASMIGVSAIESIGAGLVNGMTIGAAIEALQNGKKVARTGWNGKDMWLTYSPGQVNLPTERFFSPHTKEYAEQNGGSATVCPSIMIKNANGTISYWQPSSGDMFATDWIIVN